MVICGHGIEAQSAQQAAQSSAGNLLKELSIEVQGALQWLNQPTYRLENRSLFVVADSGTDFFNNPEDGTITGTAPLIYILADGDFVARARVRPDFSAMWNAVALMVYIDSTNWIKFAFENSDATGPGIVTVVTKGVSDDANGPVLNEYEDVWLKLVRKGDVYSMLWSLDDKEYKMARLTTMSSVDSVKIGVEVQCPVGEVATHEILYFGVEKKTVQNLRKGY